MVSRKLSGSVIRSVKLMFLQYFPAIICQRRWKALRERFGVHYKKFLKTQLPSTWENYTSLEFLSPFIDLKEKSSSTYEEYMEVDCSLLKNEGFDEFYFISLIREKR